MFDETTNNVLSKALAVYNRPTRNLDKEADRQDCRALNAYGVLSLSAIASVVGISMYKAEKYLAGMEVPTTRGHLNPEHLTMLMYAHSSGKVSKLWLDEMLDGGTSLITVSSLTNISESTLRRTRRG